MKRWILLSCVALLGLAAVALIQRNKVDATASPEAVLHLIGDTEHELTRMPARFARMPDEQEIRVGNQLAKLYSEEQTQNTRTPEDKIIQEYLTRVGLRLAVHAHRKLPYKFHYLDSPWLINAFAVPGGHVYVGGGLLSLMDSEDELAAVMGHEIEHVDHYHCAERVQQEEALRKIPLGELVGLPIEIFEAGYSKEQELEADREGTRLAVEAGFSANGAVRMFETFDRLYKETQAKAKTPQEELSQVTLETLEGYFRFHPPTPERIAQVQKMIASEGWPVRPEHDLEVGYIFLTAKAESALNEVEYAKAEQLANRSLHIRPDQPAAIRILARAQFAQAKFSESAAAYRKLIEANPLDLNSVTSYAHALAASDRATAPAEFHKWAAGVKGQKSRALDVEEAGLGLLAGTPQAWRKLEEELNRTGNVIEVTQTGDPLNPMWLGDLGWWHYLAGDYQKSVDLLSAAVQQRPQDPSLRSQLAWAQAEVRRYADALQTLERVPDASPMARAVVLWLSQAREEGLRRFEGTLRSQPEWGNPAWVKALYSPTVAQSVREMQTEQEARERKARISSRR
jgi:beta-barrel assembly-enhancing protease